jgi:hypothetical protein
VGILTIVLEISKHSMHIRHFEVYMVELVDASLVDEVVNEAHREVVADSRPWSSLLFLLDCPFTA